MAVVCSEGMRVARARGWLGYRPAMLRTVGREQVPGPRLRPRRGGRSRAGVRAQAGRLPGATRSLGRCCRRFSTPRSSMREGRKEGQKGAEVSLPHSALAGLSQQPDAPSARGCATLTGWAFAQANLGRGEQLQVQSLHEWLPVMSSGMQEPTMLPGRAGPGTRSHWGCFVGLTRVAPVLGAAASCCTCPISFPSPGLSEGLRASACLLDSTAVNPAGTGLQHGCWHAWPRAGCPQGWGGIMVPLEQCTKGLWRLCCLGWVWEEVAQG